MKSLLVVSFAAGLASADLCSIAKLFGGNWYCEAVQRIKYLDVGTPGSYHRVTSMDSRTGACRTARKSFQGPLAPLDEDLSIHFRGPLLLKQFAAYKPAPGSKTKREAKPEPEPAHHHHGHAHYHQLQREKREAEAKLEKKAVGDMVIATINGQVVSWANDYAGSPASPATPVAAAPMVIATINGKAVSWANNYSPAAPTQAAGPIPAAAVPAAPVPAVAAPPTNLKPGAVPKPARIQSSSGSSDAVHGDWAQVAYYNMDNQSANGLVFLNSMGGQGSGVWDTTFGNSLSYADANARVGSAYPQVFAGRLDSKQEVAIFSDAMCESGNCGYSRPGTVAHQGFDGSQKAFLFEFQMPNDGTSGWNMNMPAIWALNGQIPRTQQYGRCSCWKSGCGEVDIFEVLDSGNNRCKSTVHKTVAGGSSDWFERPTDKFIKVAAVLNGNSITIQQLHDDYDFSNVLSAEKIQSIFDDSRIPSKMLNSVNRLSGRED